MKRNYLITFISLFLLVTVSSVFAAKKFNLMHKNLVITTSNGTKVVVDAEIARTEESRNYGFMERKNIPDGTGMLFVFEEDAMRNFWMKNTPTALSIAYIDRNGKIKDILDMTPFSLASVKSTAAVRYALEVPQGYFKRVGVSVGDTVDLSNL